MIHTSHLIGPALLGCRHLLRAADIRELSSSTLTSQTEAGLDMLSQPRSEAPLTSPVSLPQLSRGARLVESPAEFTLILRPPDRRTGCYDMVSSHVDTSAGRAAHVSDPPPAPGHLRACVCCREGKILYRGDSVGCDEHGLKTSATYFCEKNCVLLVRCFSTDVKLLTTKRLSLVLIVPGLKVVCIKLRM